jgi:limonene-1,2-epoxide hydrolase
MNKPNTDTTQPKLLPRSDLERWVRQHIAALETRDVTAVCQGLHPDVCFVWLATRWTGHDPVQAALEQYLKEWQAVRFHLRRLLIDADQPAAVVEWVCRYIRSNEPGCRQLLGGTVLDFDENGQLHNCRTYLDPNRSGAVSNLDAPWPDEGWRLSSNPGSPPTRAVAEALIWANARAWTHHDPAQLSAIMHDEICVSPPWDYLEGRAAVEKGAEIYFANYRETEVTPHRFIIDPTQPYLGVCEQTFACTNVETGRRGEDFDLAFFEIAQGKLRYWRTYFDTTHSIQTIEQTAGYLQRQGTTGPGR